MGIPNDAWDWDAYLGSARNTCPGADATRALLKFIRSDDAALELEPGALS